MWEKISIALAGGHSTLQPEIHEFNRPVEPRSLVL